MKHLTLTLLTCLLCATAYADEEDVVTVPHGADPREYLMGGLTQNILDIATNDAVATATNLAAIAAAAKYLTNGQNNVSLGTNVYLAGDVGIGTNLSTYPLTISSIRNANAAGQPSVMLRGTSNKERISIRSTVDGGAV